MSWPTINEEEQEGEACPFCGAELGDEHSDDCKLPIVSEVLKRMGDEGLLNCAFGESLKQNVQGND